jgi:hypothetical protein
MKQLLLRVPDDLHRRISARAAREGKSMNAVSCALLDASADADTGDRRERLRARAAALGMLSEVDAPSVRAQDRKRTLASTRGLGEVIDRILDEDRGRLS